MSHRTVEDRHGRRPSNSGFRKIVDTFNEMRDKMRDSEKYSGKGRATNKLYEAIREFAPEIGALPPYLPLP